MPNYIRILPRRRTPEIFRSVWHIVLTFLLIFTGVVNSGAQEQQYFVRQFISAQGLPQNSVKSIAVDDSSFVWFTTEAGIVRYDGRNFKVYNQNSHPEITGDRFQELFRDYNGNLLSLNSYSSLFLIKNNQPELVPGSKNTLPVFFYFLGNIPDYRIYYEIESLHRNQFGKTHKSLPQVLIPLNSSEYLIKGYNCLLKYRNTELIDSICYPLPDRYDVFGSGNFYYLKFKDGTLYRLDTKEEVLRPCHFQVSNNEKGLLDEDSKLIWNYTNSSGFIKKNKQLYSLVPSVTGDTVYCNYILDNLPSNCKITSVIYYHPTRSYLVGTDTKGLLIYTSSNIINHPKDGLLNLESTSCYGQTLIDSNRVFTSFGLVISKDTSIISEPKRFNHEGILQSKSGRLYYTYQDSLYYKDKQGKRHLFARNTGLISCFYEDELTGKIIFGGNRGLGYIENDTARLVYTPVGKTTMDRPNQLLLFNNHLYVASCSGLMRFDKNLSNPVTVKAFNDICVRTLFSYKDYIFIGTYGNGYYIMQGDHIQAMPTDREGRLAQVHSIFLDKKNFLWMSTNNGLLLASLSEVINYFNKPDLTVYYYLLNQEDGIRNPEFNGGCSPSVVKLQNGYLSYPSMGGLVWINPDSINFVFPGDKIFFENITADSSDILSTDPLKLKPGFQNLSADLIIPYWGKPENLQVEYRLKSNDSWIKFGLLEKKLRFGNLPSGRYNLQVRVRYGFGQNDYHYRQLPFIVNEYFYEKTWIQIISAILFATLIVLGFRIYNQSILRKNQLLEKSVQDRTAELEESNELLHENLVKLQESEDELSKALNLRDKLMSIISHDLVTPIRYISISSRLARSESGPSPREELFQVLAEIEATTMRIYDNANNVLHWIRFQSTGMSIMKSNVAIHDLLNEVTSLYKPIADAGHTVISNNTPEEDIIISDPRILKIVFQNIVNNAVKFTKSGCISIHSVTNGRDYRIIVKDTGPGFSEAALESIRQVKKGTEFDRFTSDLSEDGTHLGYQIIFELLRFLEGDFVIESTQDGSSIEVILYNCLLEND